MVMVFGFGFYLWYRPKK